MNITMLSMWKIRDRGTFQENMEESCKDVIFKDKPIGAAVDYKKYAKFK